MNKCLLCLFFIVDWWTLTLNEVNEAYGAWDAALGSLVTCWMSHQCSLGIDFVKQINYVKVLIQFHTLYIYGLFKCQRLDTFIYFILPDGL